MELLNTEAADVLWPYRNKILNMKRNQFVFSAAETSKLA